MVRSVLTELLFKLLVKLAFIIFSGTIAVYGSTNETHTCAHG